MEKQIEKSPITELFYSKYKTKQPNWGFNGLGYITYKRTYARIKDDGTTEEWHETVKRCVEWLYTTHKGMNISLPGTYYRELYDAVFHLKCNFSGRMLWQAGTKTVDKLGGASLVNCFSGETEFLTKNGLKTFNDTVNTKQIILDGLGHWVEADIKEFGKQKLYKLNLERNNSKKSIYVTAEHEWFKINKEKVKTINLKKGDILTSIKGPTIKGIDYISPIGIMRGIVFGDGSVDANMCNVRLCGEKDKDLLKWFIHFPHHNINDDVRIHHLPRYFKDKPDLTLDKSYLYGWLAGYFAADGNVKKDGEIRLASASLENIKFAEGVANIIGISTRPITIQHRKGFNSYETPLYTLGFVGSTLKEDFFLIKKHREYFVNNKYKEKLEWKVVSVEPTNREEPVYCTQVPTTHSFVLSNNLLTSNCWAVVADNKNSFLSLFDYLMLGGGVGYNIQAKYVYTLPKIKKNVVITHQPTNDADYIVSDSREGWVNLLDKILTSYFETGESFSYSTVLIRPYGQPIKGFGGTSSGPEPLINGMTEIIKILQSREGKKLRPIDVLDIMNLLGSIVVAGNVRRSAQIALGDANDKAFIKAKNWGEGHIPNWRAMSNNTVICDDLDDLDKNFWKNYMPGNGEPYGLFNLSLAQTKGRLADADMDDGAVLATNPCGEISLAPSEGDGGAESCNLSEIYLNNIEDKEEFIRVATLIYYVNKTIAMLPYHRKETDKIVKKNLRLGMGLTGIAQRPDLCKAEILDEVYKELRKLDKEFSKENGVPQSIKMTTVKPSGTLSLLGGATPGIHPAYSRYYIRRIRMSSNDKLVEKCRDAGYKVEFVKNFDGTEDFKTCVVEFPVFVGDGVPVANETTAIDLLESVKHMQTWWSDNQVSCTVYYDELELDTIKDWLERNYKDNIKSVSFLLHSNHGFVQAPYEEITKERYNELVKELKPIFSDNDVGGKMESVECEGGACPVK